MTEPYAIGFAMGSRLPLTSASGSIPSEKRDGAPSITKRLKLSRLTCRSRDGSHGVDEERLEAWVVSNHKESACQLIDPPTLIGSGRISVRLSLDAIYAPLLCQSSASGSRRSRR